MKKSAILIFIVLISLFVSLGTVCASENITGTNPDTYQGIEDNKLSSTYDESPELGSVEDSQMLSQNTEDSNQNILKSHVDDEGIYDYNQSDLADLSVECVSLNPTVQVGEETSFKITVTNTGSVELSGIFVHQISSHGLTFTSFAGDNWNRIGDNFYLDGVLEPGKSTTLIVDFTGTDVGNFAYYVIAGSNESNTKRANDTTRVINTKSSNDTAINNDSSIGKDSNKDVYWKYDSNSNGIVCNVEKNVTANPIFLLMFALIFLPLRRWKN